MRLRWTRLAALALLIATLTSGCDEDPVLPAIEGAPPAEPIAVIRSTSYVSNQFFRLLAPGPLYFLGGENGETPLRDDSAATVFARSWSIDLSSLELFVGPATELRSTDGAAFMDLRGQGWEEAGSAATFDARVLDGVPGFNAREWVPVERRDWSLVQDLFTHSPIGIALRTPVGEGWLLACTYEIVDAARNPVRRVGRSPSENEFSYLKLLAWNYPTAPQYEPGTGWRDFDLLWEYEYRHIYRLDTGDYVGPFDVQIRTSGPGGSMVDETVAIPWIQVFGLDSDQDGRWDQFNPDIYDAERRALRFPLLRPFAPLGEELVPFAGLPGYRLPSERWNQHLYRTPETAELGLSNYFDIVLFARE